MALTVCGDEVPVLSSCPPAGSQIMLFNVSTAPRGVAVMDVSILKCCIINEMLGVGSLTITGADLVDGLYYNSGFVQNLMIFAWNIPNYLVREGQNGSSLEQSQWRYIRDDSGNVVGVDIYGVSYDDGDFFTIIPITSCTSTPSSQLPQGLSFQKAVFSGDSITTEFKIVHGLSGVPNFSVQSVGDDSSGEYSVDADSTYINITYNVAPPTGTNNVVFDWAANL